MDLVGNMKSQQDLQVDREEEAGITVFGARAEHSGDFMLGKIGETEGMFLPKN